MKESEPTFPEPLPGEEEENWEQLFEDLKKSGLPKKLGLEEPDECLAWQK